MKYSLNRKLQVMAKEAAYSTPARHISRYIASHHIADKQISQLIEKYPKLEKIYALASEQLPSSSYYAKITIPNWKKYKDIDFKIFQRDTVVYGNRIESPANGFQLEYRNIIVTSRNKKNFRIEPDIPFSIGFSHGAYITEQQKKYDEQYEVEQHGNVFYSLRGNLINPKKIIFTFPGFGPSTTRIPYSVSYLKKITEADLDETMMVCFQDRYKVSGTYMLSDNAGRDLYPQVKKVIDKLIKKHRIADENMLFFGASKGGSIALYYAQEFPKAHLLVAVPQMNLPYYMNKPFFRNNLYLLKQVHQEVQPEDLLRRYISENRKIDYFYTNTDELSNHSLIEFESGKPRFSKYRVDGTHGQVANKILPSMLNIMRSFIGPSHEKSIDVHESRSFVGESDQIFAQVRIDHRQINSTEPINWFLEGKRGEGNFRILLSDHNDIPFLKYLSEDQPLHTAYDNISEITGIVGYSQDGTIYRQKLPMSLGGTPSSLEPSLLSAQEITLDTDEDAIKQYSIIDGPCLSTFHYRTNLLPTDCERLVIRVQPVEDKKAERINSGEMQIISWGENFFELFILRVGVQYPSIKKIVLELPKSFGKLDSDIIDSIPQMVFIKYS